jgi:hypothetical protein
MGKGGEHTMKTYTVWIDVEYHDDETDEYEDIDPGFGPLDSFESEEDAIDCASKLNDFYGDNPALAKSGVGIPCSVCGKCCDPSTAHLHQGKWIGDECCWDERLKSSE